VHREITLQVPSLLGLPVPADPPWPGCLRGFGAAGDPREAAMSFSRRNWADLSRWVRAARMGSGWAAGIAGCGEDGCCLQLLPR